MLRVSEGEIRGRSLVLGPSLPVSRADQVEVEVVLRLERLDPVRVLLPKVVVVARREAIPDIPPHPAVAEVAARRNPLAPLDHARVRGDPVAERRIPLRRGLAQEPAHRQRARGAPAAVSLWSPAASHAAASNPNRPVAIHAIRLITQKSSARPQRTYW